MTPIESVRWVRRVLATCAWVATLGCGGPTSPAKDPEEIGTVTSSAQGAAQASSAPVPDADPTKKKRSFTLTSECDQTVSLFYGEDPQKGEGARISLDARKTATPERIDEARSRLWLLDGEGRPLAHVRVSRGMKTVTVGSSCRTLNAE
jgi:hypothetical protein